MTVRGPLVVMGVSGSGKSMVGVVLAERLGTAYVDGDDLHPTANLERMRAGVPLTDEDRRPWLDAVGAWLARHPDGVAACSALRRAYRDRLRGWAPTAFFVHLDGDPELVAARQATRAQHFMPTTLQDSQQRTLEPLGADESGVRIDVTAPVEEVVASVMARLG